MPIGDAGLDIVYFWLTLHDRSAHWVSVVPPRLPMLIDVRLRRMPNCTMILIRPGLCFSQEDSASRSSQPLSRRSSLDVSEERLTSVPRKTRASRRDAKQPERSRASSIT